MRWTAALAPSLALLASSSAALAMHRHHRDGSVSVLRQACRSSCESLEVQVLAAEGERDFCSLCGRLEMFQSSSHQSDATQDAWKDTQKPAFHLPPLFQSPPSPLNGFEVLKEPCSSSLEPLDGVIGSAISSSKASSTGSGSSWGQTIGSTFSSSVASASGSVEAAEGPQSSSSISSSRSSFTLVIKDSLSHVVDGPVEDTGTTTAPDTTSDEDIVVVDDSSGSSSAASSNDSDGTLLCLLLSRW